MSNLFRGQRVQITQPHNQFLADDTEYRIASISKINGQYSASLIKDGSVIGAIPENKLKVETYNKYFSEYGLTRDLSWYE